MGGGDQYDPGEASHRALRGIQRELERHPSVETVRGFPSGEFTQVVAELRAERLGVDADEPTLTVRWFAGETSESRPQFSFHYSDDDGDIGWHHEPNSHVDGWGHVQERERESDAYNYEPHPFSSTNPTRVVWEVLDLLESAVDSEEL